MSILASFPLTFHMTANFPSNLEWSYAGWKVFGVGRLETDNLSYEAEGVGEG